MESIGAIFTTLLTQPLANGLIIFYKVLGGNMGLAIIGFSLFLRVALYPLTKPYLESMKKMKDFAPQTYLRSKKFPHHLNTAVSWLLEFHCVCGIENTDLTRKDLFNKIVEVNIDKYRNYMKYSSKLNGLMEETLDTVRRASVPFVAWHGDFCAANILIGDDGGMSVIDWENHLEKSSCRIRASLIYL